MNKHITQHWWKYIIVLVVLLLGYYYAAPVVSTIPTENEQNISEEQIEINEDKTMEEQYTTTDSGLQYRIISEGEGGAQPTEESQVEVHYHGTLPDGTVFDSSKQRGETIVFGLRQVIPGWTEGLQLMSEGDVYEFYIPAELAYGDRSPSPLIPAGSDLIFEVELIKVVN